MAEHWESMLKMMNDRRKNGELCDFEIRVGEKTFKVHRLVLDTGSPYFRTMFASGMLESTQGFCKLHDVTSNAVQMCIDLMYTGGLTLDKTTVADVLKVSHMWQLEKAVKKCEDFLKQNVNFSSCIASKNLATLYELKDLSEQCNAFFLDNLEEVYELHDLGQLSLKDIIDLLRSSESCNVLAGQLWNFCINWNAQKSDILCAIVLKFPFEAFESVRKFKVNVWENCHVMSCSNCKNYATKEYLHALATKSFDLDEEESLFLKKVSKAFACPRLEKMANEYIIQHHFKVFTCGDFLKMEKDDLLEIVEQIDDKCSVNEFSAIIEWLKFDENRHGVFVQLFEDAESPYKAVKPILRAERKFLSSITYVLKREPYLVPMIKYSGKNNFNWWPGRCFFVKSLAQKFKYKNTEAKIDECIVRDFRTVSRLKEFKNLSLTDLIKYLSTPAIYRFKEEVIWNAVKRWVEHDAENRYEIFSQIFKAVHFDKFSTKFIREKVVQSSLIKDSKLFTCHLMMILLERVELLENRLLKLEHRFENLKK